MLSLSAHLNTILLKAYFYQFLLPGISCPTIKKKIIRHTKRPKNTVKTTIITMLKALKEKADDMKKQMGKCKQRDKNPKRETKRNTRNKNHYNRNKKFLGEFIHQDVLRKESLN